jgi:hypothetical protein
MSDFKAIQPSLLRIDTSRAGEYLYADKPKLSFMQKLGRSVGKAASFLGPIGAAVTAVALPGVGLPIAAGIYGASTIARDSTNVALSKDAQKMNEYNAKQSQTPVSVPGFFDGSSSMSAASDFIAPSQYDQGISQTLIHRQNMIQQNMSF